MLPQSQCSATPTTCFYESKCAVSLSSPHRPKQNHHLGKNLGRVRPVLVMALGILNRSRELIALSWKAVGMNDMMRNLLAVVLVVDLLLAELRDLGFLRGI